MLTFRGRGLGAPIVVVIVPPLKDDATGGYIENKNESVRKQEALPF